MALPSPSCRNKFQEAPPAAFLLSVDEVANLMPSNIICVRMVPKFLLLSFLPCYSPSFLGTLPVPQVQNIPNLIPHLSSRRHSLFSFLSLNGTALPKSLIPQPPFSFTFKSSRFCLLKIPGFDSFLFAISFLYFKNLHDNRSSFTILIRQAFETFIWPHLLFHYILPLCFMTL